MTYGTRHVKLTSVVFMSFLSFQGLHNRTGYLFFIVSYFTLLSMSSVSVLFTEKQAFCRERAAGESLWRMMLLLICNCVRACMSGFYSTLPYLASKLICDLIPLRVIPPLVYSGITYFMIGLNSWPDRVVTFFAMLVNVNVAAVAVCFILASLTANIQQANMFTSLVFVFNVLFGGFLLTARTTAIAGIMKLSLLNWAWRVSV